MPASEKRSKAIDPRTVPPSAAVRERARRYLAATGMSVGEFAQSIGYSRPAVIKFLADTYRQLSGTDVFIRHAAVAYLDRNPVEASNELRVSAGRLFQTGNYRTIARYFLRAVEHGDVALLHGPPGTQKTFALSHLIAERNVQKRGDALYVYASVNMLPSALLRRIGLAAGAVLSGASNDHRLESLVRALRARRAAVVVDEAQHLDVPCLEVLRELHDRSGCGLVLAGSHNLYENFLRGRQHLEQWLSRIDHRDPLPGLGEDEVATIAARELGNGQPARLTDRQVKQLVAMCRVEDIFGRDARNKPAVRQYLSVRRLVKSIAKLKQQREAVA